MKVVIRLFHGRTSPDEQLDDWGADGPLLGPFDGFHMTYISHMRPVTEGMSDADIKLVGDLVYYDGMYYGDMVIISEELAKKDFPNTTIEAFDPEKCKIPELVFGNVDLNNLDKSGDDDIVICTNCARFYYESAGSERDTNHLQMLEDEGKDNPYKGCGNCKTDDYLMDVALD